MGEGKEKKKEVRVGESQSIRDFKFFFNVFIYFWDRERQSMNRGGAEREGDKESKAGSSLRAVGTEPNMGLELTNREIVT